MAGSIHQHGDTPLTEINIIPFVDIVLVLLIIFMLTAPVMFDRSIPLELPTAATGESEPGAQLGITVLADGGILLNGNGITLVELGAQVRGQTDARALIAADKNTAHGNVIAVIDTLREAGVEKYALNVLPPEQQ